MSFEVCLKCGKLTRETVDRYGCYCLLNQEYCECEPEGYFMSESEYNNLSN